MAKNSASIPLKPIENNFEIIVFCMEQKDAEKIWIIAALFNFQ